MKSTGNREPKAHPDQSPQEAEPPATPDPARPIQVPKGLARELLDEGREDRLIKRTGA